ncbi:MAG: siroheme synthase CysG [Kangiellaceae bacterium]|nr:siroheme synthase CysG [Kangiellaceae bacterium]MCW8999552.1 siroheme synthase CysG [Kangiellaceae bacterium]MCW9016096.1 siroheme synthase CysG [Kangiellaceae bacterium]
MDYLPITVQMKDRQCLIVGGGEVAARKLKHLLKAQSKVTMVSLDFCDEVLALAKQNQVTLIEGEYQSELLEGMYLVIAATDDRMANRIVSIVAQERNIWVNVVDDLELSTFIMPAVIDRSPLLIAVSSSGVSPVLARKIREKIEWLLPTALGKLLNKLKKLRPEVKKKFRRMSEKKRFSEWYIDTAIANPEKIESNNVELFELFESKINHKGKVSLVGAGPGDPELLTVKALKLIQTADVVLYDALVSQEILEQVRKDAKLIHVGKRCNKHFVTQDNTNQLLVDYAQQGLEVVRLKGGDPFIFGRGGEELQYLKASDIDFQVVPGITAAAGCASYAGIPLTHRDYSQSVRFITAHEKGENSRIDWKSLAAENQTLVFYMGLGKSQQITEKLISFGKSHSTPVALIEKGTTKEQRVVTGELHELPSLVEHYQVQAPALIVVGEVTQLANELAWHPNSELIQSEPYLSNELLERVANL